ncbi:hypothetical protein [Bradyrhizobium tropiciagri]|uniref:hypothetical protein n=1 Tax=Bradyrhizobium tropiciagri TaxID=312253 RepID=UPI00067C3D3C|nr:hypothetical protein [Bradyrhizobium tropiciagri]
MPIDRLLQGSKLRPNEIECLSLAYARTLHALCLVDRDDPIAEIVAKKVIETGARGLAIQISKLAVEQLGIRKSPSA